MAYKIVILGSGRGSNARALLEAEKNGQLGEGEIVGVLSDKEGSRILEHGRSYGKDARFVKYSKGSGQVAYNETLESWAPDLVVLAGFMRIVGDAILQRWKNRLINLHPSLLPSFKGLDGIGQAWRYGVKVTGCTVHWVNAELDGGKIIEQSVVRIEKQDTLESLEEKIHVAEHALLIDVVARLSRGEIG